MKHALFFSTLLLLFILGIGRIDRQFFKANSSFCIRFLYSNLPNEPKWDLPPLTPSESAQLDTILAQKFHYLGKGTHCFAFASDDGRYVIKFHRYASHLRTMPWLKRPLAYQFDSKRKKIKEYNIARLHYNLGNYRNSFTDLKEESGLILVHINHTDHLKRTVTLVDKTHASYDVPLDQVTFILQHRAEMLYPTLDRLTANNEIPAAKKVISDLLSLVLDCCRKGYINADPVLTRNYGILPDRVIQIDIGDMVKQEEVKSQENALLHLKTLTGKLRDRLEKEYPTLLPFYDEELTRRSL